MAGTLDGDGECPLMLGAGPALASGLDLPSVGDISAQSADVLVVDNFYLVHTKVADLAARIVASTATAATEASSWAIARTASVRSASRA